MIIGDLATVAASTLVDDLAPPVASGRKRVDPTGQGALELAGRRAGGRAEPRPAEELRRLRRRSGWPYALVNAGWYFDPNWDVRPDLGDDELDSGADPYAAGPRVQILTWVHFDELDTATERARGWRCSSAGAPSA